jgi:hypothetical protein
VLDDRPHPLDDTGVLGAEDLLCDEADHDDAVSRRRG